MAVTRSFTILNQINFVLLHKALVRSHLGYAISISSPYKQKYKDAIDNVQRLYMGNGMNHSGV